MKFTIINLKRWSNAVDARIVAFKQDARVAVRDEIRLLLEYAMRFTPPKNLAQGRAAVIRDIKRTMRPILPEEMTQSKGLRRIVQKRDIESYNAAARHFTGTLKNSRAVEFEARIHTGQRDFRLRVRPNSMNGRTVVLGRAQQGLLSKYIRAIQNHVGIAKDGWWPALQAVGGKAASWVTRHGTTAGEVIDELGFDKEAANSKPSITLINKTGWGAREGARILNDAAKLRADNMYRRIKQAIGKMNT